ncbi:MAG: hypothetical protein O9342_06155 [Beijerinckiaceae bacterium]|nr:hypothetical protein [Beijerinckiaceae bacterium]
MRIVTGLASVVLVMGLGHGGAVAQQANAPAAAPAAPRTAQRAVPKNAAEIVLANARSGAVVTGISVTSAAGKSVATLKKPLEPGKKITIKLPKNSGCTFAVNASFSDDAEFDQTDVNLCMDKTVRFTD